ncbi:MAG TPA: inorganic diphosphatase [Anaerolineae bacterium]|nr:inorganic diphosphatase [Anaerolineae bacterium]HNU03084.1 inorganic diphosphatase [Anaerolineae bacterium]
MQNIWRDLRTGPDAPDTIYVIVEIPKGSRNKYEYQKANGVIFLDRVLYSSMVYPGDYGLIPRTFYEDGDPLDIIVMVNEPTFPGCIIQARPIGIFRMLDRDQEDAKILAVPATDPGFNEYHDLSDVPQSFLNEVAHFFEVYKDLEGQRTKPIGWENAAAAKAEIMRSVALYQERFGLKEL